MALPSIPPWMSVYSSAGVGFVHRVAATLKVMDGESNYKDFTRVVRSIMPRMKWKALEYVISLLLCLLLLMVGNFWRKDEALHLWTLRSAPL